MTPAKKPSDARGPDPSDPGSSWKDVEPAYPEDITGPQRTQPMHDTSRAFESLVIADLVAMVNRLPDEREQKVRSIKAQVDAGTYIIDARKIAERILREM